MNPPQLFPSLVRIAVGAMLAAALLSAATKAAPNPAAAAKPAKPKSVTFTGRVMDPVSGKPIVGAAVTIERTVSSGGMLQPKSFKRTDRVKTNARGEYSFTLKSDEVARPNLYLSFNVEHPNFTGRGRFGYSYAMLVKNRRLGASPFFSEIKLWPGKSVTAVVVAPDGSPVAGAKITTFSRHANAQRFDFTGFGEAKTDKNGRFRFVVPTPGEGVFYVYPTGYAVTGTLVGKQRGDLGKIVVQKGARLKGRVLDAKGRPLAGIYVGARKTGGNSELEEFLNQNAVGNLTVRSTYTDKKGAFELDDLPDGDYQVRIEPNRSERKQPANHVFLRRSVKLAAAERPAPLEARAIPHVEIHAEWIDAQGKPTRGYQFYVFGRLDGKSWFGRSTRPDQKTGKVVVAVPHGLQDAALNLITNEHRSIRWRLKPGDALRRGSRAPLGNVDDDLRGIQIVHYTAPILLIKPVDEKGKIVRDVKIACHYEPEKPPAKFGIRFGTGDVRFRQQNDGRWRSSQMLPDVQVTISVSKAGFEAKPQKLSLKEGKERELVFVLKKKPQ